MDESVSSAPQREIFVGFVPPKLKGFLAEPDGCSVLVALEGQYQCSINVVNDSLIVTPGSNGIPVDIAQIETVLREMWQKRDVQLMIREAALNVSTTHMCQAILPRAYCAVVFFYSADFQRRSRCSDIIIEHFAGKVTIFGTEASVGAARGMMIESLMEHYGTLEIDIPLVRRTTRIGYNSSHLYNADRPSPILPAMTQQQSFLSSMFSMGEPNAILTSTPRSPPSPPVFDEALLSSDFDSHLLFPAIKPEFSIPPPPPPTVPAQFVEQPVVPPQKTNNVEKIKHWFQIPNDEVGKILGNRSAMKKQIEAKFNCVITVHTGVYQQFGMTGVEIMAQNKDSCQGARDAVQSLMKSNQETTPTKSTSTDSGFNSPSATTESPSVTPEKEKEKRGGKHFHHRSSFRDQPKVMLALTPRKPTTSAE